MTAARTWTLAIVGLLGANVIAMVVLAVMSHHGTHQVIPDYYARAAHYDDELARSAASQALGWRVSVTLVGGQLDAAVTDAAGQPLAAARVRITGYQRAHAADLVDVVLAPAAPGKYRGAMTDRRGWYDLIAAVDAGGAHYVQHLVVEAR